MECQHAIKHQRFLQFLDCYIIFFDDLYCGYTIQLNNVFKLFKFQKFMLWVCLIFLYSPETGIHDLNL